MTPPSEFIDPSRGRPAVPRAALPAFLDQLDAALGHLGGVLEAPLGFGRATRAVERLRATLGCVRFLHGWPERFTLEASFTLNIADSGFPGFKDLWLVEEDRNQAAEKLASLPAVERIAESAVRDVRAGRFPLVWQRALVQRRYYERLLRTAVISGFEVGTPRLGTAPKDRPVHGLDWSGLSADDSRFIYQTLEFTTDPEHRPPAKVDGASELFKTLRVAFREPLSTQFDHLQTLPEVNPRSVARLAIGPFHANAIVPQPPLAALGDDPGAWLLECSVERLERDLLRDPDAPDAPVSTRVLVCPSTVKDRLHGRGPDGQAARIFGVSPSGEVAE
jgi:hypothetical protein